MLVFVDESGDAGFKVAKGSSSLFVAAMVIFHDNAVRSLLRCIDAGIQFNKCRNEVRDAFFATLGKHDCVVRALAVRKALIWSERLRTDDESFYRLFVVCAREP